MTTSRQHIGTRSGRAPQRFALLSFGAAGLLFIAPNTLSAQSGNASDVTGVNVSGSDVAGGAFIPSPFAYTNVRIPAASSVPNVPEVIASVPLALAPIIDSLTSGVAVTAGLGSGVPISADVGTLVAQLAVASPGSEVAVSVYSALLTALTLADGAPPADQVRALLSAFTGVLRNATPAKTAAAVNTLNATVGAAGAAYLSEPPAPLLAMRLVLLRFVQATL